MCVKKGKQDASSMLAYVYIHRPIIHVVISEAVAVLVITCPYKMVWCYNPTMSPPTQP